MPRKVPFIRAVAIANETYGLHLSYPHQVVKYENGLEQKKLLDRTDRLTCPTCNTFQDRDHIRTHEPPPTLPGM